MTAFETGMTYLPSYYKPSILELARQGNFQAIAYWINSILGPQGIYVQIEATRSGRLKIMVNFRRTRNRNACIQARNQLVRHICYRLWTLNSAAIREVRIMARVSGQRDILWQQSVLISTPANKRSQIRPRRTSTPRSQSPIQVQFKILRSFLLNRLALAGFIFCYWLIYLETTGHVADRSSVAATSPQEQMNVPPIQEQAPATPAQGQMQDSTVGSAQGQAKTAIAHTPPTPNQFPSAPSQVFPAQNLTFTVPQQLQGQTVYEASPAGAEKVVALTFDDGPWKTTTDQVLDILRQNSIKATFYWVGEALQENPDVAQKVVAEGHAIGNHTWRHLMDDLDVATAAEELGNNAKLIYQTTGVRTYLMRPPGGNLSGELANYAKQQGYLVTMWSADSHDYYVSTPLIIDNVLSNVRPGGIVLLHDGGGDRSSTIEALPQIISTLQRQGYKFVTIPELMEMQARWATMQPPPASEAPVSPYPDVPNDSQSPIPPENPGDTQLPTSPFLENPGDTQSPVSPSLEVPNDIQPPISPYPKIPNNIQPSVSPSPEVPDSNTYQ